MAEEMINCLGGFTKKQIVRMNTQENIYFNTNAAENYTDTSNQIHIPTLSNIS